MTVDTNTTAGHRSLSAFFDTRGAADKAIDDLVAAGIPRQHIARTGSDAAEAETSVSAEDKGFWDSLKDFFLPDEDRHSYAEGLRRGGYLVTVQADEANYTRVLDILDTDGAVNMDERETEWRSQGWTGSAAAGRPALNTAGPNSGILAGATSPEAQRNAGRTQDSSTLANRAYDATSLQATEGQGDGDAMARAAALDVSAPETAAAAWGQARRDDSHGRARLRSYVRGDEPNEAPRGSFSPETDRQRIVEHMDVISADGQSIGTVDHLDGPDRIKLTRNSSPDGQHHIVPFTWIDHVDQHVHLKKTLAEIKAGQ